MRGRYGGCGGGGGVVVDAEKALSGLNGMEDKRLGRLRETRLCREDADETDGACNWTEKAILTRKTERGIQKRSKRRRMGVGEKEGERRITELAGRKDDGMG